MDVLTPERRHRAMSAVKGKDTKPELQIRRLLFSLGCRFRIQYKGLPGRPDIVLPKYKTVIFVNGCFWHQHPGCKDAHLPSTNIDFWRAKMERNIARDTRNTAALRDLGWNVIVIWQCQIKSILRTRHIPGLPPRIPTNSPAPAPTQPMTTPTPAPSSPPRTTGSERAFTDEQKNLAFR